jgi:flagellar hook-associated protein 1
MSISGALSSALSGLTAASRAAEVVASNVANARTEGYGRRELHLSAQSVGGTGQGVRVDGVRRMVDLVLINDRRLAQSGSANREQQAAFFRDLEASIGTPETTGSLGARIAMLDESLLSASARPDSEARLSSMLGSLTSLIQKIGTSAASVQDSRVRADRDIANAVSDLNATLSGIADMNGRIQTLSAGGRDTSALMDQRQQMIDKIATLVPLREVARDNGTVALFTTGGAVLLDGPPAQFGFTPSGTIVPEMTIGSGGLSGLTLNGRALATSGEASTISGGRLAGMFAVRDDLAPAAQAKLDALARDLAERFADPSVDPTLALGAAGLVTDGGGPVLAANETGLAQRLMINAAVDPAQGGALWRLRDGIGAVSVGPPGDATLIRALSSALSAQRQPASGGFMAGARSFAALSADTISFVSQARVERASEASFAAAQLTSLQEMELQDGVDTDQELQTMLQIEKSYSANAKVMQAVDDMIKALLGIG